MWSAAWTLSQLLGQAGEGCDASMRNATLRLCVQENIALSNISQGDGFQDSKNTCAPKPMCIPKPAATLLVLDTSRHMCIALVAQIAMCLTVSSSAAGWWGWHGP